MLLSGEHDADAPSADDDMLCGEGESAAIPSSCSTCVSTLGSLLFLFNGILLAAAAEEEACLSIDKAAAAAAAADDDDGPLCTLRRGVSL